MLFLFVLVAAVFAARSDMVPATAKEWAACPHQRADAIAVAQRYADLDHDGLICGEEIARLKRDMLEYYEKVYLFLAEPDDIMRRCGGGDNYISAADFENSKSSCLRNCKAVMDFFKYFGDRAAARHYSSPPVVCTGVKPVGGGVAAAQQKKH